jgi:ABC-type transport system involved in multi-copper enzyme maturation permease subunit
LKFFAARSENVVSTRNRKPIFALLKKEFQLHQASLMGAAGLLVLHLGAIILRKYHHFAKDSAGETLTAIVWMLWLVMAPVIGSLAVAEERRLGVMEEQLCLPVSCRIQFAIKGFLTLLLCIFLGGVMPMLLEAIAVGFGAHNPMFTSENGAGKFGFLLFPLGITAFSACLALVSFFASTLAKSFLQAVGLGIAIFFICCALLVSIPTIFHNSMSLYFILLLIMAVPTLIVTLLWLAYLNFKNFRDGWPLWRRNLLGFAGAVVFAIAISMALYHRAWEVFEPAEPRHGPAKLSMANPPAVQIVQYRNFLVRLPDGRVWFDCLDDSYNDYGGPVRWRFLWRTLAHPLRESAGPRQFVAGSNWVAATTERLFFGWNVKGKQFFASDFMETVGIQPDGTLWLSEKPEQNKWTAGTLQQYGSETNWRQLAQSRTSIVLLKSDGTLWRWGSVTNELHQWPGLRAFTPYQIGTNSDWQELFTLGGIFARRTDGRVWHLNVNWKTGLDELGRATNYDEIVSQTASRAGDQQTAFVRADGTLWMLNRYWDEKTRQTIETGILQVAVNYGRMVALKSDGSLWQWHFINSWNMSQEQFILATQLATQKQPTPLGIHNDWVAIASTWEDVITLAADGSLWLWPNRDQYEYERYTLLKLPKQPRFLGNIFGQTK